MTTPKPPLSANQRQALNDGFALLKKGKAQEAIAKIKPVLAAGIVHVDAYWLLATACRATGQLAEARLALNAAINLEPANPLYWDALGDLLEQTGDLATARVARERAYERAPANAAIALALTDLLIRVGDGVAAEDTARTVIVHEPQSVRARHALSIALRLQGRTADALAQTRLLVSAADVPVETQALHAHLLAEQGELEAAEAAYRAVIARRPDLLDAQETFARLLPQIGRVDQALDGFAAALGRFPDRIAIWRSALTTARSLKHYDQMLEWSERAVSAFPGERDLKLLHADALGHAGDAPGAWLALARHADQDASAATLAAHWALASGDADAAARHSSKAAELEPDNVAAWAYLGTAWRLQGDARADWLYDYGRLTSSLMLETPPGYAHTADFLEQLRIELEAMHVTRAHPADQSLRQGTQTSGHLFLRGGTHAGALALQLHRQVSEWLTSLPVDPTHPFLRRNSGKILFKHSWSVRLRSDGFHISHVHQDGWLSSAFYVALPDTVGTAGGDGLPQGALMLGEPDGSLGLSLGPERVVVPQPGMLALFPSYVWHGTHPFDSERTRLTVAFDAVPG